MSRAAMHLPMIESESVMYKWRYQGSSLSVIGRRQSLRFCGNLEQIRDYTFNKIGYYDKPDSTGTIISKA